MILSKIKLETFVHPSNPYSPLPTIIPHRKISSRKIISTTKNTCSSRGSAAAAKPCMGANAGTQTSKSTCFFASTVVTLPHVSVVLCSSSDQRTILSEGTRTLKMHQRSVAFVMAQNRSICNGMLFSSALWSCAWSAKWNAL